MCTHPKTSIIQQKERDGVGADWVNFIKKSIHFFNCMSCQQLAQFVTGVCMCMCMNERSKICWVCALTNVFLAIRLGMIMGNSHHCLPGEEIGTRNLKGKSFAQLYVYSAFLVGFAFLLLVVGWAWDCCTSPIRFLYHWVLNEASLFCIFGKQNLMSWLSRELREKNDKACNKTKQWLKSRQGWNQVA